jgi:hypothetical protein
MLPRICPIPPWRKREVSSVHGLDATSIGINPRNRKTLGTVRVMIKSSTFIPIKTHTGLRRDLA